MTPLQLSNLQLWQFSSLKEYSSLVHFVTDRNNGVSNDSYESLNLGYGSGDDFPNVDTNRNKLAESLQISSDQLYIPRQKHTTNVAVVDGYTDMDTLTNTDGMITATRGICIAILVADCVPIILFDPVNRVAGVVHAGWRGTVGGIVVKAVQLMQTTFKCLPENILAGIGPSISPEVYEVGPEVIDEFKSRFNYADKLIQPSKRPGKYMLNLWQANQYQLMGSGVPKSSIEIAGICTYQNKRFYSARRMGEQCGRFAAGCMLTE